MKPRVILISGKQGSGKSSLSHSLAEDFLLGHKEQMRFAQIIYEMHAPCLRILKHYGIRPEEMEKDGELLQVLGTEYGRKRLGENVWAKALRTRVNKFLCLFPLATVILDDCRFENEFDYFDNAFKVRLECEEQIRMSRCSYWRQDTSHPSETGLDAYAAAGKFDIVVNTGEMSKSETAMMVHTAYRESHR